MATKDVKDFNEWFNRSYARLKESVSLYGKIDEDAFHDAYLAVRKQVMFSKDGIKDGFLFFRVLLENPTVGNKGRQPLYQSRRRVFHEAE